MCLGPKAQEAGTKNRRGEHGRPDSRACSRPARSEAFRNKVTDSTRDIYAPATVIRDSVDDRQRQDESWRISAIRELLDPPPILARSLRRTHVACPWKPRGPALEAGLFGDTTARLRDTVKGETHGSRGRTLGFGLGAEESGLGKT